MGRKASVRIKNGHWFSEAGGVGRYFGRCDQVSHAEAMSRMWQALADGDGESVDRKLGGRDGIGASASDSRHGMEAKSKGSGSGRRTLASIPCQIPSVGSDGMEGKARRRGRGTLASIPFHANGEGEKPKAEGPILNPSLPILSSPSPTITMNALREKYLAWLLKHRSERLHDESQRHLARFCEAYGDMQATAVEGHHLEAFTDGLIADGHARLYAKKHATSVRTMFNRAVKAGWLPPGFKPFVHCEGIRIDPRPLLESDLPTDEEVQALKAKAKGLMADVIALYHATGARTHELLEAKVGDFQPNARTIVLGKHKRSRTMREAMPRTITLNAEAHAILMRRCQGRKASEPILLNNKGNAFDRRKMAQRFALLRDKAGVRDEITLYSFRHLWISEMLMAGVDALLVARMAGTSVAMVEKVYGHFRTQSYAEAQARLDAARARS